MDRRAFLTMGVGVGASVAYSSGVSAAVPCSPQPFLIDGQVTTVTNCTPFVPGTDQLANLAATLSAGALSTALGDTGFSQQALNTIQWANRFFYDADRHTAHLLGKNASSGGRERSNCRYDAIANTWTTAVYGGVELGHVYESIAYDPASGDLYSGTWASSAVKKWRAGSGLSTWLDPVATYSGEMSDSTQPTLCWNPNLFGTGDGGLLAIAASASGTRLIALRKSTGVWSVVSGIADSVSGDYPQYGAIEYIRSGNYCIVALDPGGGGGTYRIASGTGGSLPSATRIANVPIKCGYVGEGAVGILIDSPTAGGAPYILEKGGSSRVWRYSGSSWALQSYSHPLEGLNENWVVASVYPHGVFWSQDDGAGTPSRVWRPNS
jgi:hypothetical protein